LSAANYRRPTPEFLKRDAAGATRDLIELLRRPEWPEFPLRAEFERCLYAALGIEQIKPNEDKK
jgi:hypothetical protein